MRPFPFRLPVVLLALAAAGLLLAACGGDDSSTDSTTDTTQGTPLSQEDFIAQADAICQEGDDAINAAAADLGSNPSQQELEAFVSDTVVPNITEQLNGLDELGAPEGDQEQVDEIITAARNALDQLENDPSLIQDPSTFAEANKLAKQYGLTACGDG